jgi:hypothetical protein
LLLTVAQNHQVTLIELIQNAVRSSEPLTDTRDLCDCSSYSKGPAGNDLHDALNIVVCDTSDSNLEPVRGIHTELIIAVPKYGCQS